MGSLGGARHHNGFLTNFQDLGRHSVRGPISARGNMHTLLNLIAFCAYAALAAAAALHAHRLPLPGLPPLDRFEAYTLAGFILAIGMIAHQALARSAQWRQVRERGIGLAHSVLEQQEELDWLRREVSALREALEAAGESGELRGGGRTIDEVMSEVRVLKGLIGQLSKSDLAKPRGQVPESAGTESGTPLRDLPVPALIRRASEALDGSAPAAQAPPLRPRETKGEVVGKAREFCRRSTPISVTKRS